MALRKCLECGQMVSDKAESCPNCGTPISKEKNSGEKAITALRWSVSVYALGMIITHIMNKNCNAGDKPSEGGGIIYLLAIILVIIGMQYIKRKAYILAVIGFGILTFSMFVDITRMAGQIEEKETQATEEIYPSNNTTEEDSYKSSAPTSIADQYVGTYQIEDNNGNIWTLTMSCTNETPINIEGKCTMVCEALGEEHYGSWHKTKREEEYCELNFIADDFNISFIGGRKNVLLAQINIKDMWFYDSKAAKAENPKLRLKMKRISK